VEHLHLRLHHPEFPLLVVGVEGGLALPVEMVEVVVEAVHLEALTAQVALEIHLVHRHLKEITVVQVEVFPVNLVLLVVEAALVLLVGMVKRLLDTQEKAAMEVHRQFLGYQ
jgi:hypothetical protein